VALGIDFTARDLQQELKQKGLPWERAKAFDGSAVVGNFVPVSFLRDAQNIEFELHKNGEKVQHGFSEHMLFSIDRIIAYISRYFTLKIGDLVFTGTPSGVGPVQAGDQLEGFLEGESNFKIKVK
jgi:2-keto-4-pentenoate hydratase/2-oxohepta-3-ene-1,7-dioic acid hydratase in catechol pathway